VSDRFVPPTSGMAVASLVFGIATWTTCPILGAGIAVVLGHLGRDDIRRSGQSGWGMATAGLILGYAQLALAAPVGLVLAIAFIGAALHH